MNHIWHFIKIPFINKVIDFIDLPSIFRDNTVESSIPDYFENKEPPIICYKYNKPIRSTILNFNKLVANLDIDTRLQILEIVKIQNFVMNQQAIFLQEIRKPFQIQESVLLFQKVQNIDSLLRLISINVEKK